MKYYLIFLFAILFTSCCKDMEVDKIHDKSWFPFKSNSNIVYETKNGLIDSLSVLSLDTSIQQGGFWSCGPGWENKSCILKSNKYQDFKIDINLASNYLDFYIYHSGTDINLIYKTDNIQPSSYPWELSLIDSVNLNNVAYYKILILTDTTNDFKIYYNHIGIPRYIIHNETFDLKIQ